LINKIWGNDSLKDASVFFFSFFSLFENWKESKASEPRFPKSIAPLEDASTCEKRLCHESACGANVSEIFLSQDFPSSASSQQSIFLQGKPSEKPKV